MESKLSGIDSSILRELVFETIVHGARVVETVEVVESVLGLVPFMDRQPYSRNEMCDFLLDVLTVERFLTSRQIRDVLNERLSWKKQVDSRQIVFFVRKIKSRLFPIESIVGSDRRIGWTARVLF